MRKMATLNTPQERVRHKEARHNAKAAAKRARQERTNDQPFGPWIMPPVRVCIPRTRSRGCSSISRAAVAILRTLLAGASDVIAVPWLKFLPREHQASTHTRSRFVAPADVSRRLGNSDPQSVQLRRGGDFGEPTRRRGASPRDSLGARAFGHDGLDRRRDVGHGS